MSTTAELVSTNASQIKGKVVITTGVSPGGLGASFVQAIAKAQPAWIILAGRNLEKAQLTEAAITASNPGVKTRLLQLDLESLQSVRDAAAAVNGWADIPVIDVLVNNAAILAKEYGVTVDGFERQLAGDHLGHFLFTNLIMNKILASSSPRIVNVSSTAHRMSPFRFGDYNFDGGKTYISLRAYGQAKTANILTAISLAEKLGKRGLLAFSLHPGVIATNAAAQIDFKVLFDEFNTTSRMFGYKEETGMPAMLSLEEGVATHVYAAFAQDLSTHNGAYLLDCRISDPLTDPVAPWATSPFEAEKLWRLSEELVGQKFPY
jgi:NAD(P)-dependent dehydrogenase (short-subunit alcohol dehydrogenase family)